MVSKCANPACSATFRYMHEGRLFHLVVGPRSPEPEKEAPFERFWLCDECSRKLTVVARPEGVLVVPLQQPWKSPENKIKARRWNSTMSYS